MEVKNNMKKMCLLAHALFIQKGPTLFAKVHKP